MFTAQNVLDTYWDGKLPVDVERLAQAMGMRVIKNPFMNESGMIEMDGNTPVITVNSTEYGPRQRYTIAHEIGHFALGHLNNAERCCRDDAASFKTGTTSPIERQANQFAAELLMPKNVLEYAIVDRGYTKLEALAQLFGVSEVAMKWRLVNLGILRG